MWTTVDIIKALLGQFEEYYDTSSKKNNLTETRIGYRPDKSLELR
jgi:hypothetical protein